ncbi:MAG: hypothetical protein RIR26_151 [Pseudomonadota bacterium]|jgi:KDO2-lipid IV(A) lauroyltransferase
MILLVLDLMGLIMYLLGPTARRFLAYTLAILCFDLIGVRKKLVLSNLRRVYPENDELSRLKHVARVSLANFILTTLEFFGSRRIFKSQKIEFQNAERLDEILKQRKGVYAMVIHAGNFELMAYGISRRFCNVHAPVKPIGKGKMARWVKTQRANNGVIEIVDDGAGKGSRTTRIISALKAGEMAGFMVDQRRKKGVLVPLFGEPAWTNSGLFYLWKQHAAPIVPITIRRVGLTYHVVTIHEELTVLSDESWDSQTYIFENAKNMNRRVEELILENSDEYFWMHDRWKK